MKKPNKQPRHKQMGILAEQTQNNAAGDGVLDQDLRNKKELAWKTKYSFFLVWKAMI